MPIALQLPRRPESVPEARAFVRSSITGTALDDSRSDDLLIAVSEACSNVVSHAAGSDTLRVEVLETTDGVLVVIADRGSGFSATDDRTMPSPDQNHGRGLALMDMLCDGVHIDSDPSGTRIELLMTTDSARLTSH